MSILIIKSGTTSIEGATVKGDFTYFSATTKGLGATIDTGFWSGVDPTCEGYTVYKIGGQNGWAAMVATGREQLNEYLILFGGTGTTVDENVTWATNSDNILIHSGSTGPCPTATPTATQIETPTPTSSETPTQTPTTTLTATPTQTQTSTQTPTPTVTQPTKFIYFGPNVSSACLANYYNISVTFDSSATTLCDTTKIYGAFSGYGLTGTIYCREPESSSFRPFVLDSSQTFATASGICSICPTPTPTATQTPTTTPTLTATPTQTQTNTPTPTTTTTLTATQTQTQTNTQTPTTTTTLTSTPTQTPTNTPTSTPTYSGVCHTYFFGIDSFPGEATTFGYYEFPSGTYTQINIISPDAIFANAYNYPGVFYVNGDTGYTIENYGPCGPTPTPTATNTPTPTNTPTNTRTPTPTSTTSLLSWSFVRDSGTGTYNLYINSVNVEARSSTSNGFITVSVGDEIYVDAFAGSCAGGTANANLAVTGIIIDGACQASSVSLTTSTYTVTSANIGQTIVLSTLAQCLNECL
jgi:hypothetical protein